jgi:hypothetical protein
MGNLAATWLPVVVDSKSQVVLVSASRRRMKRDIAHLNVAQRFEMIG